MRAATDEAGHELLAAFAMSEERCACCWIHHTQAEFHRWPGLQVHHLVKRSKRVCHEHWNLLRLCARCHGLAEGETYRDGQRRELPRLSLANCLWLKREHGLTLWQPELLAALYPSVLPEPEEPHRDLLNERPQWSRGKAWPWREAVA